MYHSDTLRRNLSETFEDKIDDLKEGLSICVNFSKAKAQCQRPSLVRVFGGDGTCNLRSIQMTYRFPIGASSAQETSRCEARRGQKGVIGGPIRDQMCIWICWVIVY